MNPTRISRADGTWDQLCRQWEQDCPSYNEDFFDLYPCNPARTTRTGHRTAPDECCRLRCQTRVWLQRCTSGQRMPSPRHDGLVLRVRRITCSPTYDYNSEITIYDYVTTLINVSAGARLLSNGEMSAQHIKFHLRSPAELQYGDHFLQALRDNSAFSLVEMRGARNYLSMAWTKKPNQEATT